MKYRLGWAAALVTAGVAMLGCGSDAPDVGSAAGSATTTTAAAAPSPAAPTTQASTADTPAPDTTASDTTAPETAAPGTAAPGTAAPDTTESATTDAPDTTTSALPAPNEVDVALADYSITLPATLPAGPTRFTATNSGVDEHHMTLIRLSDEQQLGDVLTALSTDPAAGVERADLFAGPQAVAAGGQQSNTATLEPGDYVALCVIPGEDGIPHAAKGMLTQFTVTGDESEDEAAPRTPSITLKEFGFTVSDDFTGHGLVRVENAGTLPHELVIYRVAADSTYAEAEAFLREGGVVKADSPVIPSGGITAMSAGRSAGADLDLAPGKYVFVCFLPGTDHMSHLQHGMMREVEVK